MPELRDAAMPSYTIHEYDPLLDSSNMTRGVGEDRPRHRVDTTTATTASSSCTAPTRWRTRRRPSVSCSTGLRKPVDHHRLADPAAARSAATRRENLITSLMLARATPSPRSVSTSEANCCAAAARRKSARTDSPRSTRRTSRPGYGRRRHRGELGSRARGARRETHSRPRAAASDRQRAAPLSRHLARARPQRAASSAAGTRARGVRRRQRSRSGRGVHRRALRCDEARRGDRRLHAMPRRNGRSATNTRPAPRLPAPA